MTPCRHQSPAATSSSSVGSDETRLPVRDCCPRAPLPAPVVEEDDAVAEPAGPGELEAGPGVRRLEQGLARGEGGRVDVGPVLVDQVVALEDAGEVGAAEREVAAGLRLEPPDLIDVDVAGH